MGVLAVGMVSDLVMVSLPERWEGAFLVVYWGAVGISHTDMVAMVMVAAWASTPTATMDLQTAATEAEIWAALSLEVIILTATAAVEALQAEVQRRSPTGSVRRTCVDDTENTSLNQFFFVWNMT